VQIPRDVQVGSSRARDLKSFMLFKFLSSIKLRKILIYKFFRHEDAGVHATEAT
jgi:hypothetical protein